MSDYMLAEITSQPDLVGDVLVNNHNTLTKLASLLKSSAVNSIYLVARGTSDHAGIYAKYLGEYFLGIPVCLAASSIINLYHKNINFKNVLTMAISQSGEGPDVIGVMKAARDQNTPSVAITNFENSTLAKEAMFTLLCNAGLEKSVAATKTCTTSMMAAAALIQQWSGQDGSLDRIPGLIARILAMRDEIREQVDRFKDSESCVVLARGFNYAAALETALKIQETCYMNARGFSTADFQHGPIAMLHQGFPVIIYAFQGPAMAGVDGLLDHLQKIGTHTLLVTNDPSLASQNRETIFIPGDYPEVVTPYLSIVFGQVFAYYLARAKGLNPDAPRGLQKVTKTL